jgi:hypothetical protein
MRTRGEEIAQWFVNEVEIEDYYPISTSDQQRLANRIDEEIKEIIVYSKAKDATILELQNRLLELDEEGDS